MARTCGIHPRKFSGRMGFQDARSCPIYCLRCFFTILKSAVGSAAGAFFVCLFVCVCVCVCFLSITRFCIFYFFSP